MNRLVTPSWLAIRLDDSTTIIRATPHQFAMEL
jgi:hypothetical protein